MMGESTPPLTEGSKAPTASKQVTLSPRDRIVLVSRGAAKLQNMKGEAFGWERVSRAIKGMPQGSGIHDLRQNLSMELQKFSGGTDLQRDITIVALEVKDKVIRLAP